MRRETRAVLFDLDDTLFPHRRFRLSGFAAVARAIANRTGLDAGAIFTRLRVAAQHSGTYGREFDEAISAFSLDVPKEQLIAVMRAHEPSLRLRADVRESLRVLRGRWRLAIVTNGIPAVQRRKVGALGLVESVDTVVYAAEHGSGTGKPERAPFLEALRRLDVTAEHAVFVGDDERADIYGAARCGLRTIQTRQWRPTDAGAVAATPDATTPDATVTRISEVPRVAEELLSRRLIHHAA
jgi:putative hydrolase of the HAD superfamily